MTIKLQLQSELRKLTLVLWWWHGLSKGRQLRPDQNPTAMQLPPTITTTLFKPIQIHSVSSTLDRRATPIKTNYCPSCTQQLTAIQLLPHLGQTCSPVQPQQFIIPDMCHSVLVHPPSLHYPQLRQYKSPCIKPKQRPLNFFHLPQRLQPNGPPGQPPGSPIVRHPRSPKQKRKNPTCR